MKISLIQEHLAKSLIHINKAVSSRPNIPVLANVLLETEGGKLKLSATNLEIGISTWIGGSVAEEGKLTVSAKLLSDFVSSLKSGKLELIQEGQKLVVKSVDNKAEFYIIPAEDFPTLPDLDNEPLLKINGFDFADAIDKTAFATSTDESRPVLTGLLLEIIGNKMTMVGLDSFRLSRKEIYIDQTIADNVTEIVPARALMEVEKLIKDSCAPDEQISIYLMDKKNQMLFQIGDVQLTTRLIEGKYPDYKQIIPSENKLKFTISKKDFADMIKVVNIFARNVVGYKAKLSIDTNEKVLKLTANVIDLGFNESTIKIKNVTGEGMETGYNVKFLNDVLNSIKSEDIDFVTNGAVAPGVFLDKEDKNFIHLIMPMRLD